MKCIAQWSRRLMFGGALVFLLAAGPANAQQAVPSPSPDPSPSPTPSPTPTPTPSPAPVVGPKPAATPTPDPGPGEQTVGDFIVNSSVEVGVRGLSVVGSDDKFRSDLNYRPGLRIFDSSFLLRRKEGTSGLFDELLINSSGWGSDPQGYTRVNVEKTNVFRFDATVRRFKYFNDLVNLALDEHTKNTRMQFGDYDLTLLPTNPKAKIYLGYARDSQTGPGLTTYDFSRDEFAIQSNDDSRSNNWHAGTDLKLGPINVSLMEGLRWFKDDSTATSQLNQGNNPTNTSRINTLTREMPTEGHHFFTRFSAHTLLAKKLDITARYIYTSSVTRFSFNEQVTGRSGIAPGNTITREQFTTDGEIKRPYAVGELGVTYEATDKLRISDSFRFDNFRINGGDTLADFLMQSTAAGVPLPPTTTDTLFLRTTGYRRFMNTFEADYQFTAHFAAHVGYRFTDRHIHLFAFNQNTVPTASDEIFDNRTNAVIFGFKARPVKGWNIYFDGEKGSADSVFTRLENNKYTNLRARSRYSPTGNLSFNVSVVSRNNNDPSDVDPATTQLPAGTLPNALDVEVKSRTFSTSVDWTATPKLTLSAGYTHLRVTSDAGIILFVTNVSRFGQSQYFMRDHFFYVSAFVNPLPRVTLFASYRISKDPGQGSLTSADPTIIIGSYPMSFQSPEARVILKINRRVDWNIGYQYYNYRDTFFPVQNYHAHLPYTSLRIYFGGHE